MTRLSITLRRFIRPLIGSLAILITFALLFISSRTTTSVQANDEVSTPRTESITATFNADPGSLGAIPDAPAAGCGQYATTTPRDVTYTVSGLTGTITDVRVSSTFSPQHTWGGDLWLELRSPGNTAMKTIFKNRGSTTATGCGSSNALAGPYNFFDTAAATNFNTIAGTPTPAGDYQANTPCGVAGCGTATPITPSFTGVANANGTWTLRILDGGGGDTGTISASTLTITTGGGQPMQHVVDYDGDGKTDYSVIRNTGGGAGGQVTWFNNNGTVANGFAWGISTDFFVPEDYDGDNKTDIAVWRPGAATQAAFYILQSQTGTVRTVIFGQTGDDPTVVGDYDGDNKADPAVYRAGATAGAQSTWFYLGSMNNPGNNISFIPWGQNGDFPAPGDYDGDGKNDFVMQRGEGGNARFWMLFANGTINNSIVFGTPTDAVVPGDYDGDQKTDIAVVRAGGGSILWFIRQSSNSAIVGGPFGASATDFITQGDYDGDGKTDLGVWRSSTGTFYSLNSGNGMIKTFGWGASGDYPVANFNVH